ncbi:conserved hypothetical protein [Pseudomonas sp. OF001]|uniref:hypothetical protein n=1 Tax=unclassified Pseudomonas TaxID=196821 RepID=UPI0010A6A296|nr:MULTISPECIES: hypothetical protein [unclassified Pseudomonas]THG85278.1 hypothetical protein E5198_04205 [Pseudomonas sp. A-1]WPP47519.1 hypothetical protein SK095_09150 [Pseudomonas sp. AN-1]CAD5376526.1 conserved hypothetical protein [Pseudomonas sp. OF001]
MSSRRVRLLVLAVIAGLLVFGVVRWQQHIAEIRASRPPGSPPPGYENRKKYEQRGHISDFSRFDNIPVDLWFGKRDGKFDTTHLRIASDYIAGLPPYHGEYVEANIVWPSLRSVDEEIEIRKKNGLPTTGLKTFRLTFSETGTAFWGTDKAGTKPVIECTPLVRDEGRGVKYCNENHFHNMPGQRRTHYWPLDEAIRTPWYKNPPRFYCYVVGKPDGTYFSLCGSNFSYNTDFHIEIDTPDEALAIDILTHFPKLIEFLRTLEVKP